MKRFISEWGLAVIIFIAVAVILPMGMSPSYAANVNGSIRVNDTEGREFTWDALATTTNSAGQCNPYGWTGQIQAVFTNTGSSIKSVWIQDGESATGRFSNVISAAVDIDPGDLDSFRYAGNVRGGPCWRLHTEDTDVGASNTVTGTIRVWNE